MDKVIQERKSSFWNDPRFHDISFSFEDSDNLLKANKMILTLVSPVFEVMFFGEFEKQDPVPIKDISYETFKNFLHFVYTENFTVLSLDEVEQLFYVANKYEVVSIEAACEKYIIKNIKNFNIEDVLKFAEMFSLKNLEWLSRLLRDHLPDPALPASWVAYKRGDPYPTQMFFAGFDEDNMPVGVGRFKVSGDTLPGALRIRQCEVNVCFAGRSYKESQNFEILCNGNLEWVGSEKGEVLPNSVIGGFAKNYYPENLAIGKVVRGGKLFVGKIHPSHGCLYIPSGEAELRVDGNYSHLIDKNQPPPSPHRHSDEEYISGSDYEEQDDDEDDDDDSDVPHNLN